MILFEKNIQYIAKKSFAYVNSLSYSFPWTTFMIINLNEGKNKNYLYDFR